MEFLYDFLNNHGLQVDTQNNNPSRLSRMPGVTRNGNRQYAGTSSSGTSATPDMSTVIEKKATDSAKAYDKSLAGTYVVTGNLNMRNGAGTGKSILTVLHKGTKVQNYGYYTMLNSVRWYSVQVTIDNVKYTGFCCGTFLRKQ